MCAKRRFRSAGVFTHRNPEKSGIYFLLKKGGPIIHKAVLKKGAIRHTPTMPYIGSYPPPPHSPPLRPLVQYKRHMSQRMTKPTKWHVGAAKTQISLGTRPGWSESSLCAQWVVKDPSFLHGESEDWSESSQGHMPFCRFCYGLMGFSTK